MTLLQPTDYNGKGIKNLFRVTKSLQSSEGWKWVGHGKDIDAGVVTGQINALQSCHYSFSVTGANIRGGVSSDKTLMLFCLHVIPSVFYVLRVTGEPPFLVGDNMTSDGFERFPHFPCYPLLPFIRGVSDGF